MNKCVCVYFADQYQAEVCGLMCDRLKLSTWKVQLGVLQGMKAFYHG